MAPSDWKRFSIWDVVGTTMRVGRLILAAVGVVGACALIANAESIKGVFSDATTPVPAKASNITMAPIKHRLMNLKFSTAKHKTPDAIVYIPAGFDPDAPMNLLIYNHGLTNNVDEAFDIWHLDEGMRHAPRNTVMVVPEWAYDPEAYSSAAGTFHQPNFFRNMLSEIFSKTPQLNGKTVDDIQNITIATFSGGFRASQSQIHRNGMEEKVRGLVLLDSLYETAYFDEWLRKNLHEFAAGRKFYQNFYFDTARNSMAQLQRLRKMVADAGLPQSLIYHDRDHPKQVIGADVISRHNIVYVYSTMYSDEHTAHQAAAYIYFPEALKAIALKDRQAQIAAGEISPDANQLQ